MKKFISILPEIIGTIIVLLILFFLIHQANCGTINDNVYKHALENLHVREAKNDNRGPEIDKWLKFSGVGYGNPYCQAFVNYMYNEAYNDIGKKNPLLRSARCATFAKWCKNNPLLVKTISAQQINMGYPLLQGDMLGWKHGSGSSPGNWSYNGHAGLVEKQVNNNLIMTIEGNTKPSNKGDQTGRTVGDTKYGHDGVYKRERTLGMKSNFPILFAFRVQGTF